MKKYIITVTLVLALIMTSCTGNIAGNDSGISAGASSNGDKSKIRSMSNPYEELADGYSVEEALACLKLSEVSVTLHGEELSASGDEYMEEFYRKVKSGDAAETVCAAYFELNRKTMTEEAYEREKNAYPKLFISKIKYDGNTFEVSTREVSTREMQAGGSKSEESVHETKESAEQEDEQPTEQKTNTEKKKYKYIRKYSEIGKAPAASAGDNSGFTSAKPTDRYVLLNEENLTWREIMRRMLSSQSADIVDYTEIFSEPAGTPIKSGIYRSEEVEKANNCSMVQFDGDEFGFIVHIAMSYAPSGSFEIVGDEIKLTGRGEDEVFVLKIVNEEELELIDFSPKYDRLLIKGTRYKHTENR